MEKTNKQLVSDEELGKVTGGYIYNDKNAAEGQRWVVVDNNGNFYKRCETLKEAMIISRDSGFGGRLLTDEDLQELRETGTVI